MRTTIVFQPTLFSAPSIIRWMITAARMMVVPGRIGRTVPIRPTANSAVVKNHQKSST